MYFIYLLNASESSDFHGAKIFYFTLLITYLLTYLIIYLIT